MIDTTKNRKAKHVDVIEVWQLLSAVCHKGANGFAVYEEGWSDAKVYEELIKTIPHLPATTVPDIRRDKIGPFHERKLSAEPKPGVELGQWLHELELKVEAQDQQIARLVARLTDVTTGHNELSKTVVQQRNVIGELSKRVAQQDARSAAAYQRLDALEKSARQCVSHIRKLETWAKLCGMDDTPAQGVLDLPEPPLKTALANGTALGSSLGVEPEPVKRRQL